MDLTPQTVELPSPTGGEGHLFLDDDCVMAFVDRADHVESSKRVSQRFGEIDLLRIILNNEIHILAYIRNIGGAWVWHRSTLSTELQEASQETQDLCREALGPVLVCELL